MKSPNTVDALAEFGRIRLSRSFFMRDFLFSDIAALHGLSNVPDDPDVAIAAGTRLCVELLEPIQARFGRLAIRSAYRSSEVNGFGNEMQKAGKSGYTCASNEKNHSGHIWDRRDADGNMGATACIVVPGFWDRHQAEGDWQMLAWWIHDHLPYHEQYFFPKFFAFNLTWRENREGIIRSYVSPRGTLTRPGMDNHGGDHSDCYEQLTDA